MPGRLYQVGKHPLPSEIPHLSLPLGPDSAVLASCDPGRRGVIEADKDIVLSLTGLHAESSSIQVSRSTYISLGHTIVKEEYISLQSSTLQYNESANPRR